MKRQLQFALFLTIFLSIYFGMHLYVFFRLTEMLELRRTLLSYILLAILSLSYIAAAIIERRNSNTLTRAFYTVSATWMGTIFLTFAVTLFYELIIMVFGFRLANAGMMIMLSAGFLALFSVLNGLLLRVKRIEIRSSKITKGLKVVQLTDIHVGTIRNKRFLSRIAQKVNSLNPDLVLVTGDIIDGSGPLEPHMFAPLKGINAPKYFSIGNHEIYEGLDKTLRIIGETGMVPLRNKSIQTQGIQVIGVDYSEEKHYLKEVMPKIKVDKKKFSILMNHVPEGYEQAERAGVDLMLSGHTHNGQVFPFSFLVKLIHKYVGGYYEHNRMKIYVSQGTGTWGPPMRLGSSNEITLITLLNSKI